jgi:RNA polymerase sigma factor (TIGR02999 family)
MVGAIYAELRALARCQARPRSFQTTSLVHEAWMKLRGYDAAALWGRGELAALASKVMRTVVADYVRRAGSAKRGGAWTRVDLDQADQGPSPMTEPEAHRDLEEALQELERLSPRRAAIVELRYFGGLTVAEVGEIMNLGERTVQEEWRLARAFLYARLRPPGDRAA